MGKMNVKIKEILIKKNSNSIDLNMSRISVDQKKTSNKRIELKSKIINSGKNDDSKLNISVDASVKKERVHFFFLFK